MRSQEISYGTDPILSAQVRPPRCYSRLTFIRDHDHDLALGGPSGGRRIGHSRLQRRPSTQRNQTPCNPYEGSTLGSGCAASVSNACLRAGIEDSHCPPPTALLLLLRPHGPQQPT